MVAATASAAAAVATSSASSAASSAQPSAASAAGDAVASIVERAAAITASMTRTDWLAIALAALLFFWALGAYNRLVALRRAVLDAWGAAAEVLRRRQEHTQALLAALHEPLAAERGALQALAQALAQSEAAAEGMDARPLLPERAAAWLAAEAAFGAAAARVRALGEAAAGNGDEAPPWAAALSALRESEQRLPFVRQSFNDAGAAYDAARALFPTSVAARVFGFGPAGRI